MIFRQLMIALFAVSVIPLLWTEANAQTCTRWRTIGGSRTCVSWTTGSEICNVKISGLESEEPAGVEVTCEAAGTGSGGEMTGRLFCAPFDESFSASTAVDNCNHNFNGVGTGHTTNAGNPGHEGDCQVTRLTTTFPVDIISDPFGLTQCNGKGICQGSRELDLSPAEGQALCDANGGGSFVTFTADTFFGNVFVAGLPDGKSCVIEQLCTLAGNGYNCAPTSEPFCSSFED